MPPADTSLPEGTDTIIDGAASDDAGATTGTTDKATAPDGDARTLFFAKIDELRGQAGDSARDFAQAGKDRITSSLDDVVKMIEDTASEIDARVGTNYGDYARRAAQGIGGFSDAFKSKDVDDLFADARGLIEKSPAVAMGVAAALGFVVARLARSGFGETVPVDPGKDAPKA
ncbi:hypothetical protein [Sphingomonas nostoxanthinifaciens]|uniref:hypothetical protein n=1 Tax=Sphingomonas nostoxanthinifaciens TaxID=2872652 RepID=UPI001CC1CB9F|nr:hypothetical protein [Sphingomonas nostoxanthinifaciens]UAK23881.1 hypothetical protein K8P63_16160 [Sphingomonas nostoxanthinifaciens]